jgi:hypothetical protein
MSEQGAQIELLGLVASHKRIIRDGSQYDHLFPTPDDSCIILKKNGTVRKDTVPLMAAIVAQTLDDTKKIAQKLKGRNVKETAENIWNFYYNHCQYEQDADGREQLRRPSRAWRDGNKGTGIDCDCYSISISSVLTNLGIPHAFRIVKYKAGWQHVYVVVPTAEYGLIIIDPVLDHFNEEQPFTENFDFPMDNIHLNGIPIEFLGCANLGSVDPELNAILTGCPLAGRPSDPLQAIKQHLIDTRNYIAKNPLAVVIAGDPKTHIKMLDYAIQNWDNPGSRAKALDILEEQEKKWSDASGLSGTYGDDDFHFLGAAKGLKKFFSKVKETVNNVVNNVKDAVHNAVENVVKYNPLSLAARGAFLLGLKINLFGLAKHLYPGALAYRDHTLLSNEAKKSAAAFSTVKYQFVNVLKGTEDALIKAILEGRAKKVMTRLNGPGELLGEAATVAALTAGSVPLINAAKALDDAGVTDEDKKKFKDKLIAFFKKIGTKFKKKKNADGTEEEVVDESSLPPTDNSTPNSPNSNSNRNDNDPPPNSPGDNGPQPPSAIGQFVKDNPVKSAAIALVGTALIAYVVSPKVRNWVGGIFGGKKKSAHAVAGLGKVQKLGKRKFKKKAGFLPKGSHVKAVKLQG